MKDGDRLEETIRDLCAARQRETRTTPEFDREVLESLRQVQRQTQQPSAAAGSHARRSIMRQTITRLASAAVMVVVLILGVVAWNHWAPRAYGLDQTVEAFRGLRFVHVINAAPPAPEPSDLWLEFDQEGNILQMRTEFGQGDTFRVSVWSRDTRTSWWPAKNRFHRRYELMAPSMMRRLREVWDPKYAVQRLYEGALEGKFDIEIEQPAAEGEPIRLTATDTTPLDQLLEYQYRVRYILLIDPQTKLALQQERCFLENGQYEVQNRQLYREHNVPIGADRFTLEPPAQANVDDRTQGIGLPQGEMTDAQVAAEVVRQFMEALIARDYEKAAKLYNGAAAEEIRQHVEERTKTVNRRIIAVGEPVPDPEWGPRALAVPFAWVFEKPDGSLEISGPPGGLPWSPEAEANLDLQKLRRATVCPVVGHPDRWAIIGGI